MGSMSLVPPPPPVYHWLRDCQKRSLDIDFLFKNLTLNWWYPLFTGKISDFENKIVSLKSECLQNPEMEVKFLVFIQRNSHWSTLSVPIAIDY